MALIKCTGCGHDVSDKAMVCPHCGHPISQEKSNICKECGEPIPENSSICPNCGCPLENNEAVQEVVQEEEPQKKKWWIWVLAAVLLCLIGGGYYAYSKLFNGGSGKDVIVELTPEFVNAIQKYEKLGSFNEGLAPVLRDGKWGFINTKGEEVIPCQYPNPYEDFTASPFYEGMALVQKDGKWGFINTKGEEVIPISIEAESIGRFSEGLAFVYIDEENFSVINKEGKTVFKGKADFSWYLGSDVASELLPVYSQGNIYVPLEPDKFAVYDNQGNKIREINQESRDELDKQNETKPYTIFIKENGDDEDNQYNTVGLKTANGTELIPAIYDGIGNVGAGEKIDAPNGVVLVILDEIGEDAIEGYGGEFDSPDTKRHYGYADLKGNDTFSNEIKEKCRKTKEKALQKMKDGTAQYNEDEIYETNGFENSESTSTGRFIGTYKFSACRQDYKATYQTKTLPSGGFTFEQKGYNTPNGYTKWIVYVVVREDGRVVKISPKGEPKYLGKVKAINSSAFTLADYDSDSSIGEYSNLYKGDNVNVGRLLGSGFDIWRGIVFDLNDNRVYRNLSDYENRDIQSSEYIIFNHSSIVENSNDTEYIKEQ